ncbi:MAG: LTA synthase family protein [Bacteroidales bacterium]|nr:LTA synthase family protein [Bacteroidales bacterium]
MKLRLLALLRLYLAALLIFTVQKLLFMLASMAHAAGAPLGSCLAALWHGLRLDSVTACYLLLIPMLVMLASCFVAKLKPQALLRWYYWPIATLMVLAFVADLVLYHFWGAKMDAADLMYAAKPKETLASLTWWAIAIGAPLVALLVWLYWRCLVWATDITLRPLHRRWHALLFLPLAALLFVGIRGGVSESTANPSYAYFSPHPFCNHTALNPLFNIVHSLAKAENLDSRFEFMPRSEAAAIAEPLYRTSSDITDTLLATPRPDILMIIWESGGYLMTMRDSVAPNLCRLAAEGVCFDECYANNFRTDRGLVSLLSGWPGLPTTSLMKMPDKCRSLPGLAETLRGYGYTTRFVYGGDIDFTNMRGYLLETGFDEVWGDARFPKSRSLSSWGAPDTYTLLPSVLTPKATAASRPPFFNTILTLSSHEPWTVPYNRLADSRMNAFAYTDSCIGVLVDSLRCSPLWDNLLIIIVPDHGVAMNSAQSTSDYHVAHIPMVWTGGACLDTRRVGSLMAQSDLPATLLAQMGIGHDAFPFSRNILSPEYMQTRHFALHAFKNGCNLIENDSTVTRFDCIDLQATPVTPSAHNTDHGRLVEALLQYTYQRTASL